MRGLDKQKQKVWFCDAAEKNIGIDRVKMFTRPIEKFYSVASGTGEIGNGGSGFNVDYDRQITAFDNDKSVAKVGIYVFVDVVPDIGEDGFLSMNGNDPVTKPDYICNKIITTQRGDVTRICIKKV